MMSLDLEENVIQSHFYCLNMALLRGLFGCYNLFKEQEYEGVSVFKIHRPAKGGHLDALAMISFSHRFGPRLCQDLVKFRVALLS